MGWLKAQALICKIEQLALPTRVSSLLLALLLGALLGGGLRTLFQPSKGFNGSTGKSVPSWKQESLVLNGNMDMGKKPREVSHE